MPTKLKPTKLKPTWKWPSRTIIDSLDLPNYRDLVSKYLVFQAEHYPSSCIYIERQRKKKKYSISWDDWGKNTDILQLHSPRPPSPPPNSPRHDSRLYRLPPLHPN